MEFLGQIVYHEKGRRIGRWIRRKTWVSNRAGQMLIDFPFSPDPHFEEPGPMVRGVGGTPQENAEITKAILTGTEKGPKRMSECRCVGDFLSDRAVLFPGK